MGAIKIFRSISKNFKVCRYPFYKLKTLNNQSVAEVSIIHFSLLCRKCFELSIKLFKVEMRAKEVVIISVACGYCLIRKIFMGYI